VIAAAAGAAVWLAISFLTDRREAWDSPAYFAVALPALALLSAVLGYLSPARSWRYAAAIALAQFAAMIVRDGVGSLFPLGIVAFAILAIPNAAATYAGSLVRARLTGG